MSYDKECRKDIMKHFLLGPWLPKNVLHQHALIYGQSMFYNADILVWHRLFKLSFSVTRETKLQTFKILLIHGVIPCNKLLSDEKDQG